jgi:GNAT superfamily N-acetyltransferase
VLVLMRTNSKMKIQIRLAAPGDIPVLQALIEASVRGLQTQDYTATQIEGALETVFGVDSQLITDRTYFVAEMEPAASLSQNSKLGETNLTEPKMADPNLTGSMVVIAGCGGWSKRKTLYGSDQWKGREDTLLDPRCDAAKIRAFFIHPAWARRGIGSMILEACEAAARAAGFTRYEMGATLTGVKLFEARGYVALEHLEVPLANGESLPVVHMEKQV